MTTKDVSPTGDTSALAECEETIRRGLDTFIAVGEAFARVRDERLYKAAGYESFDRYCREKWDLGRAYVYRLINASEVADELPPGTPVPANDAQARELTKVPPEARAEVMEETAQATGGKPTAHAIKDAATKREAKKPRPAPVTKPAATTTTTRPAAATRRAAQGGESKPDPMAEFHTSFMRRVLDLEEWVTANIYEAFPDEAYEGLGDNEIPRGYELVRDWNIFLAQMQERYPESYDAAGGNLPRSADEDEEGSGEP